VDVSAIPGTLFPLVVSNAMDASFGALFHFIAIHALCVILASVFTFCTVFAVFGLAAAILPRNAFGAISSGLRGAALIAFLMLLLSGFVGLRILREIAEHPASPLRWLPSLWFLGLYQTLQHRPTREFVALARLAWQGVLAAFGVMVVAYAASYRRRFSSSLEGGRRPSQRYGRRALLAVLDLFAPRAVGFGRAGFRFVTRALLQHEGHRLCLAVALGLGWLLAIQSVTGAGSNSGARTRRAVSYCATSAALSSPGIARAITGELGGRGVFGVELFVKGDQVWFSEVSPRPHDTGLVTLASQRFSEFELHARAILGLPVDVSLRGPGRLWTKTALINAASTSSWQ